MTDIRASIWKRAAGLVEPLSDRALQAAINRGEMPKDRARERRGEATQDRPGGPVVWLHARGLGRALNLSGVIARLWEERPDLGFLLTTRDHVDEGALMRRLPSGVIHQYLPYDRPQAAARFLAHWRPDLCLWSDAPEAPILQAEADKTSVPTCLFTGDEHQAWTTRRLRGRLRQYQRVFAPDTATLAAIRGVGVPSTRAMMVGDPREDAVAPRIDEAERSRIAAALGARVIWLAAGVPIEELADVIAAHRVAARQVSLLSLLLLPDRGADIATFVDALNNCGLSWIHAADLRRGGVPADLVLADREYGAGLWYHLSTVSFMGGSLVRHGGQSPLSAVALGSAVLYGPHVGYYSDIYERLDKAGAVQMINDARSLAGAVAATVVPEVSAQMAHAAWQVCSDGATATDAIVEELLDLLSDVRADP